MLLEDIRGMEASFPTYYLVVPILGTRVLLSRTWILNPLWEECL